MNASCGYVNLAIADSCALIGCTGVPVWLVAGIGAAAQRAGKVAGVTVFDSMGQGPTFSGRASCGVPR